MAHKNLNISSHLDRNKPPRMDTGVMGRNLRETQRRKIPRRPILTRKNLRGPIPTLKTHHRRTELNLRRVLITNLKVHLCSASIQRENLLMQFLWFLISLATVEHQPLKVFLDAIASHEPALSLTHSLSHWVANTEFCLTSNLKTADSRQQAADSR